MNILLIEDDAGLVELITTNLEEMGFYVKGVTSGSAALAYLNIETTELIWLDYSLPDLNGKEFIEALNKNQIPVPPFIIATGKGDERIAVDMMKLGAKDYLVKDSLFLEKLPDIVNRVVKEIEADDKLKEAEDKIRKYQDHLEELVKERTIELEEKNRELEYFNELFVDREFRIKELRVNVQELEEKLKKQQ